MQIILFALLGLATGAVYALLSQGLVVIYRGSGILNFAQGAIAMFGAYAYYEFSVRLKTPLALAAIISLILCCALGAIIQLVVLRSMRRSSALSRVIVTLGILLILQSLAFLLFGENPLAVPSLVPTGTLRLFSGRLFVGDQYIFIFVIGTILNAALFVVYRYTPFGRITTAVAERESIASSLGYSPMAIATINWMIGSFLAGLAGVLIGPVIFLEPTPLVLLVIPAMAAALIGQFRSFPITFAASLVLGVAASELTRYVTQPGWGTAVPFLVVIAVLVVRGRNLPLRSFVLDRMPAVGNGRPRWIVVALITGLLCWLALASTPAWSAAIATTAASAIICLSVVVLTGYAGQLSLAQFVLAGVGALLSARFTAHMPFIAAVACGAVVTAVIGGILGLPALRTRGITLAVATLGLGEAVFAVVLNNGNYTGAFGIPIPPPTLFGWNIDPLLAGNRYAMVVIVILVLISVAVANLRRSVTGRRLLATRSNERAAASLGVNVALTKTYAFSVAAGIAAVGGATLAFIQPNVEVSTFDSITSILIVALVVVGGVGNVAGAWIAALLVSGGIFSQLFSGFSAIDNYLPLVGGLTLVVNLMFSPDGIFENSRRDTARFLGPLWRRITRRQPREKKSHVVLSEIQGDMRVEQRGLRVSDISVRFGGVDAVRNVSITVESGEVHGLIGPNGAGKTTLIDAISGFVSTRSGEVVLGGIDMSKWSAHRRASLGLSRSFQSLELFTDLSIAENLAVACDRPSWFRYFTDFFRPGRITLGPAASEALRQFDLDADISKLPDQVSFGHRKTVAIARSIASSPSVLLLDEPAAGLDDREAGELATLIRRLADEWGIAILLVEHKVDMIMSISDRVTVLQNGAILATGLPDEVRNNPAVMDAYLGGSDQEVAAAT